VRLAICAFHLEERFFNLKKPQKRQNNKGVNAC